MPFLFFLGLLATGAVVGSLVELGDADPNSADDSDATTDESTSESGPSENDNTDDTDNTWVFGDPGTDEELHGTDASDTIIGNAGDADTLTGAEGDDTLWVGQENTAAGGTGSDTFIVQADGHLLGDVSDFDPAEDTLIIRDFENPVEGGSDGIILSQDEDGLALRDGETGALYLALPGAELPAGGALTVVFQETDGEAADSAVMHEDIRSYTVQDAPYVTGALRGTAEADHLVGDSGDNVMFGESGADLLQGGAGNDDIFSGSGSVFYNSEWNHAPGHLDRLGTGDTLHGGAGQDNLWLGSGNEASGGSGADTFYAFAGVYDTASEITDFEAGEDRLMVNFGLGGSFGVLDQNPDVEYFTVSEAAAAFEMHYDADTNRTSVTLGSHPLLVLNGDQTDLSVAFSNQDFADNYGDPDDYEWLDRSGNIITGAEAQSADIVLSGMAPQDLYDANGLGGIRG